MADEVEIARWLIATIRSHAPNRVYRTTLIRELVQRYGDRWVHTTDEGETRIDARVFRAFGPLQDEFVIWDSADQSWRIVGPRVAQADQRAAG